jgi:hypothetical protein
MTLPLAAATCLCSIVGGILVSKFGHYVPFMILGSIATLIGAVLFTRFQSDTGASLWAPTLILIGVGIGLGSDLPQVAVQTVLSEADIPLGIGVAIFAQTLGQSIFISVVGSIANNELVDGFRRELPSIDSVGVLNAGATELQSTVGGQYLGVARQIYDQAITRSFYTCVAMAALALLAACAMEWNSVKDEGVNERDAASVPGEH